MVMGCLYIISSSGQLFHMPKTYISHRHFGMESVPDPLENMHPGESSFENRTLSNIFLISLNIFPKVIGQQKGLGNLPEAVPQRVEKQ